MELLVAFLFILRVLSKIILYVDFIKIFETDTYRTMIHKHTEDKDKQEVHGPQRSLEHTVIVVIRLYCFHAQLTRAHK